MKRTTQYIFLLAPIIFAAQDLTVASGGSLTIAKNSHITVNGNYSNNSDTVSLQSDSDEFSSLLVSGTMSRSLNHILT